jgi:hypothetical protein
MDAIPISAAMIMDAIPEWNRKHAWLAFNNFWECYLKFKREKNCDWIWKKCKWKLIIELQDTAATIYIPWNSKLSTSNPRCKKETEHDNVTSSEINNAQFFSYSMF